MKSIFHFSFLIVLSLIFSQGLFAQIQLENGKLAEKDTLASKEAALNPPAGEYIPKDTFRISYEIIKRDETKPLNVFPGKIRQNNRLIANYTVTNESWEGKIIKKISFYLPNGVKVAEAYLIGISKDGCQLTSFRDNVMHEIEVAAISNTDRVRILAKFLVKMKYI